VKKKWPFPGDHPINRARKMALAYRHLAEQQQLAIQQVREVLEQLDRRLLAYKDPGDVQLLDNALKAFDDTTTEDLDKRFTDWGETWHADIPQHYEMDDYVKADVAASLIHIGRKGISAHRISGRLKGHFDPAMGTGGGYWYQVRDVYELSSKLRGRNWRKKPSPVTLQDSRRSDTECPSE
jgi:hypothetical protein